MASRDSQTLFYLNASGVRVPTTPGRIGALVATGEVLSNTLVWCEGMADWKPCIEYRPALFSGGGEPARAVTASAHAEASAWPPLRLAGAALVGFGVICCLAIVLIPLGGVLIAMGVQLMAAGRAGGLGGTRPRAESALTTFCWLTIFGSIAGSIVVIGAGTWWLLDRFFGLG